MQQNMVFKNMEGHYLCEDGAGHAFHIVKKSWYSGINIITVSIRLGIIAVTVITAVILIIVFTIYAGTVIDCC